ncbi:hypothetical protein [Aeromonas caviae]|uniref:hypothetical protein n=1 Tax=Aeromonas caviae TaxID=648 RepID=UPI0028DF84FC|nr:hypothetical protein [Aeromonas caviae]MDT8953451.1 hypothetical protein [Aeromonas caviae]
MQRGECSGCGCPPSLRPCQPEHGPLRYRILGALASDNSFTTSQAGSRWAWPDRGPDPYSIRYRHRGTLLGATQVTDYKVRLYPTRLPGQVVRTGPYTGTIMVTVSVP